jgi:hypothetical protein
MKHGFAIILLGAQNSGKTSTILRFDTMFDMHHRIKKRGTVGWRQLLLHSLQAIVTWIYFIPGSPTETKKSLEKKLKDAFNKNEDKPELLLIAEQVDRGESWNKHKETVNFLIQNGYEVMEIVIGDEAKDPLWQKWNNNNNRKEILEARALAIGSAYRKYIMNATIQE